MDTNSNSQEISNFSNEAESLVGAAIQDDTLGIKGEVMFVSTDDFEESDQYTESFLNAASSDISETSSTLVQGAESLATNDGGADIELNTSTGLLSLNSDGEEEDVQIDYLHNPQWLSENKHIFILSESGKPIYSRYGKEDRLVTLFGLIQALVSFVADGDDVIRSVNAGNHKFVFLVRSPLILLAVSSLDASVPQLFLQLTYIHGQIVSVLTATSLTRVFEKRRNCDFRHMLGGTERLLNNLINLMDKDPSFVLGAVKCLPLPDSVRDSITQIIIKSCAKIKNLVFGVVMSNTRLISLVRMKKFLLHPADLHILFNLVSATESLKTSENWMPICLPKFDPKGFMYAHVSYLAEDCEACLLLLSIDKEQFFTLSEAKQKIVSRLRRHHCLEKINEALRLPDYGVDVVGAPELRHFIYKSRTTTQFTSSAYTPPYNAESSQRRLFGLYQSLHHRVHSISRPLKMVFLVSPSETLVGWVTKDFELYSALEPLTVKSRAINTVNKILQWVKSEENKYFILNSPTF